MENSTETLQQLYRRLARKRKLALMLEELRAQLTESEDALAFLHEAYLAEQADLRRAEGESVRALLLRLMQRLGNARNEAEFLAAAAKAEAAEQQLAGIQDHISALLRERTQYEGAESALTAVFQTERQRLAETAPRCAAELLAMEQRIAAAEAELHEVEEALAAGERVLAALTAASGTLERDGGEDAENGEAPLLALAAALLREGESDDPADGPTLPELLRRYRTELADVTLSTGTRLRSDRFLRFADDFFDALFAAPTADARREELLRQLAAAVEQTDAVQARLAASQAGYRIELERLCAQRDAIAAQ